jgi:hypothetical protein
VNSPQPKPEAILTNFFAEPTVLLVPITSRVYKLLVFWEKIIHAQLLNVADDGFSYL